jgi:hypothetical protein
VVRLILTPAGEAKYMQKAPVMVEGRKLPAGFETEEVHEMIGLLTKLLRTMERSAACRGIIAPRKA